LARTRVKRVVVVGELAVEQAEELGERLAGMGFAGHRALGAGEQVVLQPLGEDRRVDPAAVGLPAAEGGHPLLADAGGRLRRWIVGDEGQRDVPVDRGEQLRRRRVVGVQDGV
jgi:hypothetical protein